MSIIECPKCGKLIRKQYSSRHRFDCGKIPQVPLTKKRPEDYAKKKARLKTYTPRHNTE